MVTSEGRCICSHFAPATEAAALSAAAWIGRDDRLAADRASREAMAAELANLPIEAKVVAGRAAHQKDCALSVGEVVGRRVSEETRPEGEGGAPSAFEPWDLAVDPLEGHTALARGIDGALSMIAAGPAGSLMAVPEMYMQKMVVGGGARGVLDMDKPVTDNIKALANALGRRPEDLTLVVLHRSRHEDLIEDIRRSGARIRLIDDGDVSAGIAAAVQGSGVDMYIGIGGSTEGILCAAALRCLGGEIQARFWPVSRHQVELVRAAGLGDVETRLTTDDMARDGVIFCTTAVTGGRFLRAVDARPDGVVTQTLTMCSRCHAIRVIETIHRAGAGGPPVSLGTR